MTHRELFIRTLNCEKIGGRVPHFELHFYLTMELLGIVHPDQRHYAQWNQMSYTEQKLHVEQMARMYIDIAERYEHSAIHILPNPNNFECTQWLLETIRDMSGDEYYLQMHGDPTWGIPDGDTMVDFAVQMIEEPEKLNDISKRRTEQCLEFARKLDEKGHLLDGFGLCADYCFNDAPFFSPAQFEELIYPYLREVISEYRKMGYYTIKHTDGNVMPILKDLAACKPHGIHSLDPQGKVDLKEARRLVGENVALIGNVNCALLQTGTDEECDADVMRALREGMAIGKGYVFSTSNCVYTGLPLARYERMWNLWKKYGVYGTKIEEGSIV